MCGLAFLYDQRVPRILAAHRMEDALAAMRHRGPDDGHVELVGNAILGHRRLSIIDLSGSIQPMQDATRRYTLVFNGEIYNYTDVRSRLEGLWNFATHGDTEVLLAGLVLEGAGFLEYLEGMWSFALWDAHTQKLLLGRDRMGKKPLFLQILPEGGVACASELPALRKLNSDNWHEDEDSTADYLRYGYCLPGFTSWSEVQELLPGHYAIWEPGSDLRQKSWWHLHQKSFFGGVKDAQKKLRESLILAVERRLVADVEVGAFLSGGVDSSLICAIVRRELDRPLKSFTIGFEEAAFDERRYARLAANTLGTDHYEEILSGWDEHELERLLIEHIGQPFSDASLLPTALVSRIAASKVKVALSGDGGDELFCGYQRYQARSILRWYTRLPKGLRHLAEKAVRVLPEPMVHHSRSVIKKAHLFMDVVERQHEETPYFAPLMFTAEQLNQLAPGLKGMGHMPPAIPEQVDLDDIKRMMFADALIYLPQDILVKVDRASMAHALEARAPFLDKAVIELAFSLPRHWHRRGGSGKRMLQETFSDLLPKVFWHRRKQGFGVPIHEWFRGNLGDRLQALAYECKDGPLLPEAISTLISEHRCGRRDHGYRLWNLYSYLLWRQHRL